MSSEFDDMPPLVDRLPLPPPPALFILPPDDAEDGLPPLVDRPPYLSDAPPAPTTFTFCTDDFTSSDAPAAPRSHTRKRDANYIPRPPNAFILFRASFVKAQAVPTKVVNGSHASLSKIVGHVWKTMDKDQRAHWEQAAVAALAAHKERYPDWRFRPAANGNAGGSVGRMKSVSGRKRKGKRGDDDDEGVGGRGGGAKRRRGNLKDKDECERIANFVKSGLTGDVLASAVQAWDAAAAVGADKSVHANKDPAQPPAAPFAGVFELSPVVAMPVAQHPPNPPPAVCTPLTEMYRCAPSAQQSHSPPPFIPRSPLPSMPTSPVSYTPAQEAFGASMLFGGYGDLPAFGGFESYHDAPAATCAGAGSGYAPASPAAGGSGFAPAPGSPGGSGFYSPASPASSFSFSPTSVWSDRRGSFGSLSPEVPFATPASTPARAAFDPNVAIYDPADAPAPVDPYAFGACADFGGVMYGYALDGPECGFDFGVGEEYDQRHKSNDAYVPAWSGVPVATYASKYSSLSGWDATSARVIA